MKQFLLLTFMFLMSWQASAQCPGCVVDLPTLPEDTIFLGNAPDGMVSFYYDEDISFRLPKTTDPVAANDPMVPGGLVINDISITNVSNLPPGLSWEASQLDFIPADETDGCVKLCGIPTQSDTFYVSVNITATLFGIPTPASFEFPVFIAPTIVSNDGFTTLGGTGCGSTEASFLNNFPSNGNPGFSYNWNFGNGTSSSEENPGVVSYNDAGVFDVTYEVTIDTIGYFLNGITVTATDCNDFNIPPLNQPDLYYILIDPTGTTIFTSDDVANTAPPVSFSSNFELDAGTYTLEIHDEELIGDETCGIITFTRDDNGTFTDGSLEVELNIVHPVSVFNSADVVTVFALPAQPSISAAQMSACVNEPIELTTTSQESVQWMLNGDLISGAIANSYEASVAGDYSVVATNANGCQAISDAVTLTFTDIPVSPVFDYNTPYLEAIANDFPANATLQWYFGEIPIQGANDVVFCPFAFGDGSYSLELTDPATGCSNTYEMTISDLEDCNVSTSETLADLHELKVFPNPTSGLITVSAKQLSDGAEVSIVSLTGQLLQRQLIEHGQVVALEMDLRAYPKGMYLLRIEQETGILVQKVVLR